MTKIIRPPHDLRTSQISLAISVALALCQVSLRIAIKAAALPTRDWRTWMMRRAIGNKAATWYANELTHAALTDEQRAMWETGAWAADFTPTAIAYPTEDPITAGLTLFELASALYAAAIVTAPGEPGADNALAWAMSIAGLGASSLLIGSRSFNGATDRIDWPNIYSPTGQPLTLSAWAWFNEFEPAPTQYILNLQDADDVPSLIWFIPDGSPNFSVQRKGSTGASRQSITPSLTPGVWTHILTTLDATMEAAGWHAYVNGALSDGDTQNGADETAETGTWCIGGRTADDLRNFDGRLAQVAAWKRVLTAIEIENLAAGYAADFAAPKDLKFYFRGNTSHLAADPGGPGTANGTTQLTGNGNGPGIITIA